MSEVVVNFESERNGVVRKLRAISGDTVRAVFPSKAVADEIFSLIPLEKRPARRSARVPPGITLVEVRTSASGRETLRNTDLKGTESGPGDICYWVGGELICWE